MVGHSIVRGHMAIHLVIAVRSILADVGGHRRRSHLVVLDGIWK